MPLAEDVPEATKVVDESISEEDSESTGSEEVPADSTISSSLKYLFFGIIVLIVPVAIFAYCGGLQWIKSLRSESKGQYQKVDDEELEKEHILPSTTSPNEGRL